LSCKIQKRRFFIFGRREEQQAAAGDNFHRDEKRGGVIVVRAGRQDFITRATITTWWSIKATSFIQYTYCFPEKMAEQE
jgi:hypothetical protein